MTALPIPSEADWHWHHVSNAFWCLDQASGVLLALAVLASGLGVQMTAALRRRGWPPVAVAATFFALYFAVDRGLHAIVDFAWDGAHDRALGRAPTPAGAWWAGQLGGLVAGCLALTAFALVLRAVAVRAPRRGWIAVGATAFVLVAAALVAQPLATPATPLADGPTEHALAAVAAQAGVPRERLFERHCEPATACSGGEVIGVGPTRRVLLNVDLLKTLPPPWARQTMAHEAHHEIDDDNLRALPVLAALALLAGWIALRGTDQLARRHARRLGFDSATAPAALPLAMALLTVTWLALRPPLNLWRQHVELDADRFALQTTGDAAAQAAMMAHFADQPGRLPQPSRFYQLFRDGHPSDAERVKLADDFAREAAAPR